MADGARGEAGFVEGGLMIAVKKDTELVGAALGD